MTAIRTLARRPAEGRVSRDAKPDELHRARALELRDKRAKYVSRNAGKSQGDSAEPVGGVRRSQDTPEVKTPAAAGAEAPDAELHPQRAAEVAAWRVRNLPTWRKLAARTLARPCPDELGPRTAWLRDVSRASHPSDRCAQCGWTRVGEVGIVERHASEGGGFALASVATCGSVHGCPVCAAKIKGKRAAEIVQGVALHRAKHGERSLTLLTLTIRHEEGQALRLIADGFQRAWNRFRTRLPSEKGRAKNDPPEFWDDKAARSQARRKSKRIMRAFPERFDAYDTPPALWEASQLIGCVYGAEVTHGENGWHYHRHALMAHEHDLTEKELARLQARAAHWWAECVALEMGEQHRPDLMHGCRWQLCAAAEQYISKLGLEVSDVGTKTNLKGRTQWDLFAAAARGNQKAAERAREYVDAMHGHKAVQASTGLLKHWTALGWKHAETDEELADDSKGARLLIEVPARAWSELRRDGPALASALRAPSEDDLREALRQLTTRESWRAKPGLWGSGGRLQLESELREGARERYAIQVSDGLKRPTDAEVRARKSAQRAAFKAAQDAPW